MKKVLLRVLACTAVLSHCIAGAQTDETPLVPLHAVVQSAARADAQGQLTIALKLDVLKKAHSAFPVIAYRVTDARMVQGLKKGDTVSIKAKAVDGTPTLMAIERAAPNPWSN